MTRIKIGTTFDAPLMDSTPEWTVTELIGDRVVIARTASDWLDAPNHEAAFKVEVVQASIAFRERMDCERQKSANFWDSVTPGDTLHYHNGFGEYVRCTVTRDRNFQPIALVGSWSAHQDYYIMKIEDGTGAWRPHPSCIFEAPGFVAPRHRDAPADPRPLAPLEYMPSGRAYPMYIMVSV